MGDYSIAKSYKGILRLAHIMEYNKNFKDELLQPYYYGNPTALMDISGGNYSVSQYGYPNPIQGLSGSSSRYSSENPSIGEDELRINRVPMTDSMGNYMNWNIGLDGVTIGSDQAINGNDLSKNQYYTLFPVLTTSSLQVGFTNKLPKEMKAKANDSSLIIENGKESQAMLIIENTYDATPPQNSLADVDGWVEYTSRTENDDKLRTIYTVTSSPKDYDVFMYHQDNYQSHSIDKQNTVKDCFVSTENLRDYIKEKIRLYLDNNVVEVPSGAVIWQYCSLDKWYASRAAGDSTDLKGGFPGHRPPMNIRTHASYHQFYDTLIQGACKNVNHLISQTQEKIQEKEEQKMEATVSFDQHDTQLDEVIPLYKRDYVLCDGSKYRISYRPNFKNGDISNQREAFDRFLNLFFVLGYKYTKNSNLSPRTDFRVENDGSITIITFDMKKGINDNNTWDEYSGEQNKPNFDSIVHGKKTSAYRNTSDNYASELSSWGGNYPELVYPFSETDKLSNWGGLDDTDVLFGMDYASMVLCEMLYNEFRNPNRFNHHPYPQGKSDSELLIMWNSYTQRKKLEKIEEWIRGNDDKGIKLHQKYIFNTFVTDTEENVVTYIENTNKKNNSNSDWNKKYKQFKSPQTKKVFESTYYNGIEKDYYEKGKDFIPKVRVGREVNSTTSWIKIYDHHDGKYKVCQLWQLPNVQLFMRMLASYTHSTDDSINKFCYMYFNYDFQVPALVSSNPIFIGSSGICWADPYNKKIKGIQSWTSNFTEHSIPHRHAVFYSPIEKYNDENADEIFSDRSNELKIPSASCCHNGSMKKNSTRIDGMGNYIVNDIVCGFQENTENINGFSIKILELKAPENLEGAMADYDLVVTGEERRKWTRRNENGEVESPSNKSYAELYNETLKSGASNIDAFNEFIDYEKDWTYSFRMIDDPRFDTAEPNRGITSGPSFSEDLYDIIRKSQINQLNYPGSNANYFSMEHVSMIPLIKI